MPYKVICTNCNFTRYKEHLHHFSSTRCNNCNSVKFGLIKYEWVSWANIQLIGDIAKIKASYREGY